MGCPPGGLIDEEDSPPMGLTDAVQRWRAHRRLHKGRCKQCDATLRDDATDRFCSDECATAHVIDLAF